MNNQLMLGAFGYIIYSLYTKSALPEPIVTPSLCDIVGYTEPCFGLNDTLRWGVTPVVPVTIAGCDVGPYGIPRYLLTDPASGNFIPINECELFM